MKILSVRVIVEYADMRFSIFAIEYLRENEKVLETVLPVHKQKNDWKSRDHVPLKDEVTLLKTARWNIEKRCQEAVF